MMTLIILALFAGTLFAGTTTTQKGVPQASLTLQNSNMALGHCNCAEWALVKTTSTPEIKGEGRAEWTVTATKVSISDSHLKVFGFVTISNTGSASATIGNILVNLQTDRMVSGKHKWVSGSVDVADATNGDMATMVNILAAASQEVPAYTPATYAISGAKGTFKENAASGNLEFTDADSNTVWAITPQQTIPAGGTVNLLFEAEFNNSIMQIPAGASVRAEVIVSFGNAGSRGGSGASGANIDINGNGTIDPDEAYIRSVPSRITMTVPELLTCNDAVTLTDPEPIATGTVTMENFNNGGIESGKLIGANVPPGTAYIYQIAVDVSAGELGGSVFNTAYLDSDDVYVKVQTGTTPIFENGVFIGDDPIYYSALCCEGIQLEATSEVVVNPERIPVDPPDDRLNNGEFKTFLRGTWKANGNPQGYQILVPNWSTVYPSGSVSVGGFYKMTFNSSAAVGIYLPQGGGNLGVLTTNMLNPESTSAGKFGGEVLALRLNVDFSAAGKLPAGTPPISGGFGSLLLANFVAGNNSNLSLTAEQAAKLNGLTISQVLADAEHVLGGYGATSTYGLDVSQLDTLAERLNDSCNSGTVSPFDEEDDVPAASAPVAKPAATGQNAQDILAMIRARQQK